MKKWLPWQDKKEYPQFWLEYANKQKDNIPQNFNQARFVILDTETTGFDFKNDRIISLGAIAIENMQILISKNLELYINQDRFNPLTVEIHGILKNEKCRTYTEIEAIEIFLKYIGNAILVAHHSVFDITMINKALKRNGLPKIMNSVLDTVDLYRRTLIKSNFIDQTKNYTLDEIAYAYDIDLADRHTAAGDAFITALIFLRSISKLLSSKNLKLNEIL